MAIPGGSDLTIKDVINARRRGPDAVTDVSLRLIRERLGPGRPVTVLSVRRASDGAAERLRRFAEFRGEMERANRPTLRLDAHWRTAELIALSAGEELLDPHLAIAGLDTGNAGALVQRLEVAAALRWDGSRSGLVLSGGTFRDAGGFEPGRLVRAYAAIHAPTLQLLGFEYPPQSWIEAMIARHYRP